MDQDRECQRPRFDRRGGGGRKTKGVVGQLVGSGVLKCLVGSFGGGVGRLGKSLSIKERLLYGPALKSLHRKKRGGADLSSWERRDPIIS